MYLHIWNNSADHMAPGGESPSYQVYTCKTRLQRRHTPRCLMLVRYSAPLTRGFSGVYTRWTGLKVSGTILQHLESGCLQLLTLLYLDYSRIVSRGLCVPVLQGTGQRSRAYVISFGHSKAELLNDMPAARYRVI